jgi:hypothetical protein
MNECIEKINRYCKSEDLREKFAFALGYLRHDALNNEISAAELYEILNNLLFDGFDD